MATKKASKQAASREMSMFQWKLREIRQNWVAYLMIAPYMILLSYHIRRYLPRCSLWGKMKYSD
jgi:hypothetical protein